MTLELSDHDEQLLAAHRERYADLLDRLGR